MYKWLRISFACLAAVLCAVAVFLGIYLGMLAFLVCAAAAVLLFVLSMFFRYLQQEKEGVADEPETGSVYDDAKSSPEPENLSDPGDSTGPESDPDDNSDKS